MDLNTLLQLAGQQAHAVLIDLRQPLMPTWLLYREPDKVMIVATPWESDQEKLAMGKLIKARLRRFGCTSYSFVCEAWAAWLDAGEYDPVSGEVSEANRASNRPNRREIVTALAADKDKWIFSSWGVMRDVQGHVYELRPEPPMEEGTESSSWLAELLR
jgi:hypothetical protein